MHKYFSCSLVRTSCLLTFLVFSVVTSHSQDLSSEEILSKSIAYHDPEGDWSSLKANFYFEESRPDGSVRNTSMSIDNNLSYFTLNRGDEQIYEVKENNCEKAEGGDCSRGLMLRNYYTYLWGLPMKLRDPGTDLSEIVGTKEIDGISCYVLEVVYEKDTWHYFINKENYALIAYDFYKNEDKTKGEFISTEGTHKVGNMIIPNSRTWYQFPDNKILGTDKLVKATNEGNE